MNFEILFCLKSSLILNKEVQTSSSLAVHFNLQFPFEYSLNRCICNYYVLLATNFMYIEQPVKKFRRQKLHPRREKSIEFVLLTIQVQWQQQQNYQQPLAVSKNIEFQSIDQFIDEHFCSKFENHLKNKIIVTRKKTSETSLRNVE